MSQGEHDPLDRMLEDFFGAALEPRVGRCEGAFRQYLANAARSAWRRRAWVIGAFSSGLAASIAALWAAPLLQTSQVPQMLNGGAPGAVPTAMISPVVERVDQTNTQDEGVILLDGQTPVRVIHRQGIERTRWFDGHDAVQAQQVSPRDDLLFVKLKTY